MSSILDINHITKSFKTGSKTLDVLKDISLNIEKGESVSIVGPSGSGKTTLLGLCAGLDTPTSGEIILDGSPLHSMNQDELAKIRNQKIGYIFQNFQLIPTLTALENVMIPGELKGMKNIKSRAESLLNSVGLKDRNDHYPVQLSGGEQQRVAIARAFINDPIILFADEPTGNLDENTSDTIVDLLFKLNEDMQTTLVLVTHDTELAKKTDRIFRIKGGKVTIESGQEAQVSHD